MSRFGNSFPAFAVAVLCATVPVAYGQATRTWVSGVGDDANPCSRTAPCKTLPGAISKTAAGGEINAIDSGGFGVVTITKGITIDLTPVLGGVLASGSNGIVINAGANDVVTLRGLDINGIGFSTAATGLKGIEIIQAGKVIIEDCEIYGFNPRGISVEPTANPVQVFISRTRIRGSASNGIVVAPATAAITTRVTLNNVDISDNLNFGLSITAGASVVVRDSTIVENGLITGLANVRIDSNGGSASLDLDNVMVSGSYTGLEAYTAAMVRISNSSIIDNTGTALSASGTSTIQSYGNNRVAGNGINGSFTGTISLQ